MTKKIDQFNEFEPSFLAFALGGLRRLAEAAFETAKPEIVRKIADNGSKSEYVFTDIIHATGNMELPLSHGHLPTDYGTIPLELSRRVPFKLKVKYDGENLAEMTLELMMLNPRFELAEDIFVPANIEKDRSFTAQTQSSAPIGLLTLADPDAADINNRYQKLRADITSLSAPAGFEDLNVDTLLSRFDFTMTWEGGESGKTQNDIFGRNFGLPSLDVPFGIQALEMRLFSPMHTHYFDSLLFGSGGYALHLPAQDIDGNTLRPTLVYGPPKKKNSDKKQDDEAADKVVSDMFILARDEFGLSKDFTGLLFPGLEVHWLGEDRKGHDTQYKFKIGVTAIALGDGARLGSKSKWYTSFHAGIESLSEQSYLSKLSSLELSANLVDGAPTSINLRGTFKEDFDHPYEGLNGRTLRLSMTFQEFKDKNNDISEHLVFESAFEGEGDKELFTFKPADDNQRFLAAGLVLAPIILARGKFDVNGKPIPGPDERRYFKTVLTTETIGAAVLAAGLGKFLEKVVLVDEIRFVGARLQAQPALLNGTQNASGTDVGLLFDYEVDFKVIIDEAGLRSKKITTRIDGSGFGYSGADGLRWVQVPAGIRELTIADQGLWELGDIGKIIKVAELSLRSDPRNELRITLKLDGNLGIVTAGDFVLSIGLEEGAGLSLEAFPSKVSFTIPKTLKAAGILLIGETNGEKDIAGSLDITLIPGGLRAFAGVRVAKAQAEGDQKANALMATAKVRLPTAIPLLSSGFGISGFEGLYASHFERNEEESTQGVPKPLKWLEQVDGQVAESITEHKERWSVAYDSWAFGLGVEVESLASSSLINLNTMLLLEKPGPVMTLFASLKVFKKPKNNYDAAQQGDFKNGIFGLLQYDGAARSFILAALAEVRFKDYVHLRASLEVFAKTNDLSNWHIYLGTPQNRISGTLKIANLLEVGVSGYLMLAGHELTGLPGPTPSVPGFAIALGAGAYIQIGGGEIYLRIDFSTYLVLSISKDLFGEGGVELAGELRLFIVSVGVSGRAGAQYLSPDSGPSKFFAYIEVCGSAKVGVLEVEGCLGIAIGEPVNDTTVFEDLVGGCQIIPGFFYVHGAVDGLEEVSAKMLGLLNAPDPAVNVQLDSAIVVDLAHAPAIDVNSQGFTQVLRQPRESETKFQMGRKAGSYTLRSVTLEKEGPAGTWIHYDYNEAPAVWWPNTQSSAGGQAVPRQLALLTREPLPVNNNLVSEEDIANWVDAILNGLCDPALAAQDCVYRWSISQLGNGEAGTWILPAVLRSKQVLSEIGVLNTIPLGFQLLARSGAGTPTDQTPDLPYILGGCFAVGEPEMGAPVPLMRMIGRYVVGLNNELQFVTSDARLRADISGTRPVEILLAADQNVQRLENMVICEVTTKQGNNLSFSLYDPRARLEPLDEATLRQFHEDAENWTLESEAFAKLQTDPNLAGRHFLRLQLNIQLKVPGDYITEIKLRLNFENNINDLELWLGAVKFLPEAELARFDEEQKDKVETIKGLQKYLESEDVIPVLEPGKRYRVGLDWKSEGDNAAAQGRTYEFRTTKHPPVSAKPYVISQYPTPGEKFHYWTEKPGFGLGSAVLFEVLAKFPDARLKIRIMDDDGNPVTNQDGDIDWQAGQVFNPADLLPGASVPKGIETEELASLPTALQDALREKMKPGEGLECLGNIDLPKGGLWVGLDVALRPRARYAIDIRVVEADGINWNYPAEDTKYTGDASLLSWSFETGVHGDMTDLVVELTNSPLRHRILREAPFLSPAEADDDAILVIADKDLEDAIADVGGGRPEDTMGPTVTVYWVDRVTEGTNEVQRVPQFLGITSADPLYRTTLSIDIIREKVDERIIRLPERVELPFQDINLERSKRIEAVYRGTKGFTLLAKLSDEAIDCELVFDQSKVERVVRPETPERALSIKADWLRPRTMQRS